MTQQENINFIRQCIEEIKKSSEEEKNDLKKAYYEEKAKEYDDTSRFEVFLATNFDNNEDSIYDRFSVETSLDSNDKDSQSPTYKFANEIIYENEFVLNDESIEFDYGHENNNFIFKISSLAA